MVSLKGFKAIFQVTACLKQKFSGFTSLFCFVLFFFYLDFCSQTFTIHRTAGEEGGYLIKSSQLHRHLNINWAITAESSPMHIVNSRT